MQFILPSEESALITADVEYCGGRYDPERHAYIVPGVSADQVTRLCSQHGLTWRDEEAELKHSQQKDGREARRAKLEQALDPHKSIREVKLPEKKIDRGIDR